MSDSLTMVIQMLGCDSFRFDENDWASTGLSDLELEIQKTVLHKHRIYISEKLGKHLAILAVVFIALLVEGCGVAQLLGRIGSIARVGSRAAPLAAPRVVPRTVPKPRPKE